LLLQLAGEESAQFSYEIPRNGAYRAELERSSDVRAGYAVVTPDSGQITPGGTAVFRVKQSGNIVTEAGVGSSASLSVSFAAAVPASFTAPAAVAVDPFGNIYVSESGAGRVKVILRTGEVVSAAQAGTFAAPTGMAISQTGKIVVAERCRSVRQVSYGEPQITSLTAGQVSNKGGTRVTIKGSNFAPDTLVVVAGNGEPGSLSWPSASMP